MHTEKITPKRLGQHNIIVCERETDPMLSVKLSEAVKNVANEQNLQKNEIYAIKLCNHQEWSRGTVKFIRSRDKIPVLQFLDKPGLHDFDPSKMCVRKISDPSIKALKSAEIKLMVYGVGHYNFDREFSLIFEGLIKNVPTLAVYNLIEAKDNIVHQCFAGDFLFELNGKLKSFREVLIREKITYPCHADLIFNQQLFLRAVDLISSSMMVSSAAALWVKRSTTLRTSGTLAATHGSDTLIDAQTFDVPKNDSLLDRYYLYELIGEGSVSFMYKLTFLPISAS